MKAFVKKRHEGQTRKQGTPYYLHPFSVCQILKEYGFSKDYQIAGLGHDLLEDTQTTKDEIRKMTNRRITKTIVLVTKEENYQMKQYMSRIRHHKMARIVKLADRIHNLQEVGMADLEFQIRYLKETEKYFIKLAKGTKLEKLFMETLEKVEKEIMERIKKEKNKKQKAGTRNIEVNRTIQEKIGINTCNKEEKVEER